jgi:hypothetical protein
MALRKQFLVTVIPAVEAVEGQSASLVCVVPPPPTDTGGSTGTDPPPTSGGEAETYYYVPNDPNDPLAGEVRTPGTYPPEWTGYTCEIDPSVHYIPDPNFPNGVQPVYERRCYWNYPP